MVEETSTQFEFPTPNTISPTPTSVDKSIDNTVRMKSVRTQCDPRYFSETFERKKQQHAPQRNILKVKISKPSIRTQECNTELSFLPTANVAFYIQDEYADFTAGSDESFHTEAELDESYNLESVEEESDDESDYEDAEIIQPELSPIKDSKFIVFWSCLLPLFNFCSTCFENTTVTKAVTRGSLLIVSMLCKNSHDTHWQSQPDINGRAGGNVLLAASLLYSGNTFTKIKEMMQNLKVAFFSHASFYRLQRKVLFPAINIVYKIYRNDVIRRCISEKGVDLIGDGRSDSPGYNAKYGTYTLMNSATNEIVDCHVVHVSIAGNSSRMEKKGLEILLEKMNAFNLPIRSLTTDRHTQIRCFMKNEKPDILHQFDVWHVGKNIKKKLASVSKKKDCAELSAWIRAVINHLWWCCASCNGDVKELKEKWVSIMYHIRNKHRWENHEIYKHCQHSKLTKHEQKRKRWLKEGSPAFIALERVVMNKTLLGDLKYLASFNHTGNLEVFHSLYNKYCPKRLHFGLHGMIARSQLAILDFNAGANVGQAQTKDGRLRYKQSYSKVTQNWVVKKIAAGKSRNYIQDLFEHTIDRNTEFENNLPQIGDISKNIAPVEKPDKEEAVQSMRTRFVM